MNAFKLILFAIIFISFSSCGIVDSSEKDMNTIDSLSSVLASKKTEIERNLNLLDDIDAALKEANPTGSIEIKDPEKVKAIDQEIFEKINLLRDKLETDNLEIEKLNKDLAEARESAEYRKDLVKKISTRMEEYEKENTLLKQQISRETQNISNLTAELEAQGIKISQLRAMLGELNDDLVELKAELNLGFYLVGSKKELKRDSIIVKKGVGGAITLSDKLDNTKFKRLNKRSDNTINLTGFRKVELVPERPESSYKKITKDKAIVKIEITDPDRFWEVSNYLVIVVK